MSEAAERSLADDIREFRAELADTIPEQDHLESAHGARELVDSLDAILEEHDEDPSKDLELVVEYRQQFTVRPPDLNEAGKLSPAEHRAAAEDWFWSQPGDIAGDVIQPRREPHVKNNLEVLAVRERDSQ